MKGKPKIFVVGFSTWKTYLRKYFSEYELMFIPKNISKAHFDVKYKKKILLLNGKCRVFIWGLKAPDFLLEFISSEKIPVKYVEDGFVRSVNLGATKEPPQSLCLDSKAPYFNAEVETDLENLLNYYSFDNNEGLVLKARKCINFMVNNNISKYNHVKRTGISKIYGEKTKKRILVIGQVEDDASIMYGLASVATNNEAVRIAAKENPDAEIYYKPHPDVLSNYRSEKSNPKKVKHLCKIIEKKLSLSEALETIDHVYTITSLSGFEALIRGIKVTTLGAPFYSGWGVTDDRVSVKRRDRTLSTEQIFAIAYLVYPRYFDPETGRKLDLEAVLNNIHEKVNTPSNTLVFKNLEDKVKHYLSQGLVDDAIASICQGANGKYKHKLLYFVLVHYLRNDKPDFENAERIIGYIDKSCEWYLNSLWEFIKEANRLSANSEELVGLFSELCEMSHPNHGRHLEVLMKARDCVRKQPYMMLQFEKKRDYLLDEFLNKDIVGVNSYSLYVEALYRLRMVDRLRNEFESPSKVVNSRASKIETFYNAINRKFSGFKNIIELATLNDYAKPDNWKAFYMGKQCNVRDVIDMPMPKVGLAIHKDHYVHNISADRRSIISDHQEFFVNLIDSLHQKGVVIIPVNQYSSNGVPLFPYKDIPLISYHTNGSSAEGNVFHYKNSYVSGYFSIDTKGFSGWSSLASLNVEKLLDKLDVEASIKFREKLLRELIDNNVSKYDQPSLNGEDLPGQYIFYATQVVNDVVAQLSFFDHLELLKCLAKNAIEKKKHLVIKRHPLCSSIKIKDELKSLCDSSEYIHVTYDSVHKLIENAEKVVVVNSGVGFEALIHGKKVYTCGRSDYLAVTHQVDCEDKIADIFSDSLKEKEINNETLSNFVYFYLNVYCKDKKSIHGSLDWLGVDSVGLASEAEVKLVDPKEFFTPDRLDLVVKLLYAESRLDDSSEKKSLYKHMYQKHILYRNRAQEDEKSSIDDFLAKYDSLIDNIYNFGFSSDTPVPLTKGDGGLANGAHRVAASMALGMNVFAKEELRATPKYKWGYSWFESTMFSYRELNEIVSRYVQLKKDFLSIYCAWGASKDYWDLIENIIVNNGGIIVASREFSFRKSVYRELIKDVYSQDKSAVSELIVEKADILNEYDPSVKILLVEFPPSYDSSEAATIVKAKVRDALNENIPEQFYASLHCSDSSHELDYLAKIFFSYNNIYHLEKRSVNSSTYALEKKLDKLRKVLKRNNIDLSDVCVVGGASLEIYGLRQADDVDIILNSAVRKVKFKNNEKSFLLGEDVDIVRYGYHRDNAEGFCFTDDQIISDTSHHYIYRGVKFASLDIIYDRKSISKRDKDLFASMLISGFLGAFSGCHKSKYDSTKNMPNLITVSRSNPVFRREIKTRDKIIRTLRKG